MDGFVQSSQSSTLDCAVARSKEEQARCSNGGCNFTVIDADFDAALATLDIDALNAEHAASHAFAQQHAYATSTGFLTRPHAAALSKVEEQAGALITWPAWEEYNTGLGRKVHYDLHGSGRHFRPLAPNMTNYGSVCIS